MGHIDHGKSTLLDFIRKSNIVAGESGGITQHIGSYLVSHKNDKGEMEDICFLDTPGHAAFTTIRERGARAADIAILVVSAEDSVKPQTIEALKTIQENKIPFIVAINKTDRPNANIEKTKIDLSEAGVYLEGYGGDIPFAAISAKTGDGIPHLLELILIIAEIQNFTYDPAKNAEGVIIESRRDAKRGISAMLVVKDGVLKKGDFVIAGESMVGTRILENYLGKPADKALAGTPVTLVGFDTLPPVGAYFQSFNSKKEAEIARAESLKGSLREIQVVLGKPEADAKIIPLVLKADTAGSLEAIERELTKIVTPDVTFKIVQKGIGAISENDLSPALSDSESLVIGFNVKIDSTAEDMRREKNIPIEIFTIIYKLTEHLATILEVRRPRKEIEEIVGTIKILKTFSRTKERQVVGGRILTGQCGDKSKVKILRREEEISHGKIVGLQVAKIATKEALEGTECGILVEAKIDIAPGDTLLCVRTVTK